MQEYRGFRIPSRLADIELPSSEDSKPRKHIRPFCAECVAPIPLKNERGHLTQLVIPVTEKPAYLKTERGLNVCIARIKRSIDRCLESHGIKKEESR